LEIRKIVTNRYEIALMPPEYEEPGYFDRLETRATRVTLKDGEIAYLPNFKNKKDMKVLKMLAKPDGVATREICEELNVKRNAAVNYLNIPPYYRYSKKSGGERGNETVWYLTSFRGTRLVGDEFRGNPQKTKATNDSKLSPDNPPIAKTGSEKNETVENAIALCPNCHRKAHFG
jgi:hypothetical protein